MRSLLSMVSCLLALNLVALFPAAAAQDFTVEEDLEFARGLMKRRMHDLAMVFLESIRQNPRSSGGERASANLEIANVWKDKFGRGMNLAERMAASEEADKAYQAFVTEFRDHPQIIPAKFEYAEFLVYLGRYRTRLYEETLEVGGTQADANQHRDIAYEKLKRAADLFEELKVLLAELDDYKDLLELSRFYRAILYYDLGKAQKDEASRMATFQEGIAHLEDYIFENEDNLRGFRGYLYKALCHREFSDPAHQRDALDCFDGVIRAYLNVIASTELGWKSWEEALGDPGGKDLLETTFWHYAETLNRFGNHQKAIELIDRFRQILREGKSKPANPGLRALLEQAQAHFMSGRTNEAIGIVSDVSTEAGMANGLIQFHCNRALARFLDEVENKALLDPEVVFKAAKGAFGQDRWYEALRHFQTVLAIKKGSGPEALECWDYIGRCYQKLDLEREAALAWANAAFTLKAVDPDKAADLARRARTSYTKIARASNNAKEDEARLKKHREMMDQVFGTGSDVTFEAGQQLMIEGRHDQAIEEFATVEPKSEKYDIARAFITNCLVRVADGLAETAGKPLKKEAREEAEAARDQAYEKAIQAVDEYLSYTRTNPIRGEPIRAANREQAISIAMLSKAMALKELKRWDEGLSALAYFDSGLATVSAHLQQATILKVQLLLGKRSLEAAESELRNLESKYGPSPHVVSLKGQLGAEYRTRADELDKQQQRVAALNALVKSVAYRHAWLEDLKDRKDTDPRIENLFSIAKDLYDLNRFDEAKVYLDTILERWGGETKPRGQLLITLRLTRTYLARCLVWQGKYMEAEPILRSLHEERKQDLTLMKEFAELLTGAVREVDGNFVYIPGRGADQEKAMEGFKLWARVLKLIERETTDTALAQFLEARFHQNLVRWAQGQPENAQKSIDQLRVSIAPTLDRRKGAREPGFWERRFSWLEKQIRQKAPQSPPPAPAPRGTLDLGGTGEGK
ncbi:MAG: hypothetical protein JXQ29_07200 [Planctomycetes bacterium]|nr:hypothetical protein [Planctomycetota bacterium]